MPDAAASAVRLIRYLRELARARREPIRDVAAHDEVHWLADLPEEVYVETDAGPGDVLFSVPVIPLSPPAVLEEFDAWLCLRRWYRTLRALTGQGLAGREAVLATGLLTWQPQGAQVRDHLLTTPVRIALDERTERIDVLAAGRTALRDRELLEGVAGFQPARTEWLRDAVYAGQGCGLQDSLADVLRKWCTFAFDDAAPFREDWAPEPPPSAMSRACPKVRVAPALVVRQPGPDGLTALFDALITELSQPGAVLPAGLARLLDPGEHERLLQIEDRSPQALAELLAGLLARGRRVLVATSTAAAAGQLHAALPAELAPLGVLVTGSAPAPAAELATRFASYDPYRHERRATELGAAEAGARHAVGELRERLGRLVETQTYDVAPGYRGTLDDLAARVRQAAADHDWLPVRPDAPSAPPLSEHEAAELVELLAARTPERAARTRQLLPEPASLPGASEVRALVEAEAAARARAGRALSPGSAELAAHLRSCDAALLARLGECAAAVARALRDLGLGQDTWDRDDWAVRALTDGLTRRAHSGWDRLAELAGRAAEAERALRTIGSKRVVLPSYDHEQDLADLTAAALDLREYLSQGGVLRRGPLKPAQQRRAEPLLAGATVDGVPPTTPELLDLILAALSGRMACRELAYAWETAGVVFAPDAPLARAAGEFANAYARLSDVRTALRAIAETRQLLGRAVPLTSLGEWQGYVTVLGSVRLMLDAARAGERLAVLRRTIELEIRKGGPPPELHQAAAAIAAGDVAAYERCLAALSEAHGERLDQARCEELSDRLGSVHPELMELLEATAAQQVWADRLSRWEAAWTWAHVSAFLSGRPRSEAESRLRAALSEAVRRQRALGAELSVVRAWGWCLSRMHAPTAAAAPAWIVPLARVPDLSFRDEDHADPRRPAPPRADAFDVVIVDHEGGVGAEALFLLWLAPRMIVVGPAEPPPPPALPVSAADPPGALPAALDEVITPVASLFEVLTARSAPRVRTEREPLAELRTGRSIASYKRAELAELVGRLAAADPARTDEQLVASARELLDCPADEQDLVDARLHYAIAHLPGRQGV